MERKSYVNFSQRLFHAEKLASLLIWIKTYPWAKYLNLQILVLIFFFVFSHVQRKIKFWVARLPRKVSFFSVWLLCVFNVFSSPLWDFHFSCIWDLWGGRKKRENISNGYGKHKTQLVINEELINQWKVISMERLSLHKKEKKFVRRMSSDKPLKLQDFLWTMLNNSSSFFFSVFFPASLGFSRWKNHKTFLEKKKGWIWIDLETFFSFSIFDFVN